MPFGDEFEEFVAAKLGVDLTVARQLLERAREGEDERYEARAALFAFALREPVALAVPRRVQESAVRPFVDALLDTPGAQRAFANDTPTLATACAGVSPA